METALRRLFLLLRSRLLERYGRELRRQTEVHLTHCLVPVLRGKPVLLQDLDIAEVALQGVARVDPARARDAVRQLHHLR